MFLNKKGWHKFMSICLCIAALCITNKHSLLPLETGGKRQQKSTIWIGGWDSLLPRRESTPPTPTPRQVPSEVPRQTPLSLLSPPCRVVFSPGSCPRPWSCPSLPRTLLSSLPSCSLTPSPLASSPISNLSSCSLSGHCFGIGINCNLIG